MNISNTFNLPKKVYFKRGCTPVALRELSEIYHCQRAMLVSDSHVYQLGFVTAISKQLQKQGIRTSEFFSFSPTPSFNDMPDALCQVANFWPDVIIGIGGGNALQAAKFLFLAAGNPELDFLAINGPDQFAKPRIDIKLVLIATTFGSGAQTSSLAVLENEEGRLCVANSERLLPEISVTDSDFTKTLTPKQVKFGGLTTLTYSLRTYVDKDADAYVQSLLEEAIGLVLKHLPAAIDGCPQAREHLHNAGALAGSAYGNIPLPLNFRVFSNPSDNKEIMESPKLETLARNLGLGSGHSLMEAWKKLM